MSTQITASITPHMMNIISEAKVIKYMVIELFIMLIQAYFIYQQTIIIQTISSENLKSLLTSLIYLIIGDKIFRILIEYILNIYIVIPVENTSSLYFTNNKEKADPEYTRGIKNNHNIIPDGIKAITSLVKESLSLFQPLLQVFSRFFALASTIDPLSIVYVLSALISLFIIGMVVLMYDYRVQKENHKKDNIYTENKRNILQGYLTYYVNGMMKYVSEQLSINVSKSVSMIYKHESRMSALYNFIELFVCIVPLPIINAIVNQNEVIEVSGIYLVVTSMFWNTWWLFWQSKHVIISTSTWGTMEEFLANYIELDVSSLPNIRSIEDIMPILAKPEINEVRLYAESGGGKTTWMLNKVIDLSRRYKPGAWLYMEQNLSLSKDDMSIKEFMSLRFPDKNNLPSEFEDVLLRYAKKVGIDNLIRTEYLNKPFKRPSGGEVKRIMFLQFFLPIIMKQSQVKVAFLDEITAGLDPGSFQRVRDVIEELKSRYVDRIKFVTIDHHEYKVDLMLEVMKKEVSKILPLLSTDKEDLKRKSWSSISSYLRFEDESDGSPEEDEESSESFTKEIRVWIPDLEEEEPIR